MKPNEKKKTTQQMIWDSLDKFINVDDNRDDDDDNYDDMTISLYQLS